MDVCARSSFYVSDERAIHDDLDGFGVVRVIWLGLEFDLLRSKVVFVDPFIYQTLVL